MGIIRYAEDIIVGTTWRGNWEWFLGEKEDWFLGWQPELSQPGVEANEAIGAFLRRVSSWRVSTDDLRELLRDDLKTLAAREPDYLIVYTPSLFVDFDNRHLFSLYPEPVGIERQIPPEWTGEYENFIAMVPRDERYWLIDGKDVLGIENVR